MDTHTKHTPGPWLIEGRGPYTIYANVSWESTAGHPENDPERWTEKHTICKAWQGNSELIAAAPKLYEQLEKTTGHLRALLAAMKGTQFADQDFTHSIAFSGNALSPS
jgi:hypothetical protein